MKRKNLLLIILAVWIFLSFALVAASPKQYVLFKLIWSQAKIGAVILALFSLAADLLIAYSLFMGIIIPFLAIVYEVALIVLFPVPLFFWLVYKKKYFRNTDWMDRLEFEQDRQRRRKHGSKRACGVDNIGHTELFRLDRSFDFMALLECFINSA